MDCCGTHDSHEDESKHPSAEEEDSKAPDQPKEKPSAE